MCESLDDETLKVLEQMILENHPNTYTFTKNLAEQLILTKAKDLPIAIVRPSIICAAKKNHFLDGWRISPDPQVLFRPFKNYPAIVREGSNHIRERTPSLFRNDLFVWRKVVQNAPLNRQSIRLYSQKSFAQSVYSALLQNKDRGIPEQYFQFIDVSQRDEEHAETLSHVQRLNQSVSSAEIHLNLFHRRRIKNSGHCH